VTFVNCWWIRGMMKLNWVENCDRFSGLLF
jgi:hypothetical protein